MVSEKAEKRKSASRHQDVALFRFVLPAQRGHVLIGAHSKAETTPQTGNVVKIPVLARAEVRSTCTLWNRKQSSL